MIINYVVRNLEAVGLGPLDSPQRVVTRGFFGPSLQNPMFQQQLGEWLRTGYTVEMWREEERK